MSDNHQEEVPQVGTLLNYDQIEQIIIETLIKYPNSDAVPESVRRTMHYVADATQRAVLKLQKPTGKQVAKQSANPTGSDMFEVNEEDRYFSDFRSKLKEKVLLEQRFEGYVVFWHFPIERIQKYSITSESMILFKQSVPEKREGRTIVRLVVEDAGLCIATVVIERAGEDYFVHHAARWLISWPKASFRIEDKAMFELFAANIVRYNSQVPLSDVVSADKLLGPEMLTEAERDAEHAQKLAEGRIASTYF